MDTISRDHSSLFPRLLQLSTEGKGFGYFFPRCCTKIGNCKNCCESRAVGVAGQDWGLPQESSLRVPSVLVDSQSSWVMGQEMR